MGYLAETIAAEPATSAEAILAEMLAGVMKVDQVAFDDHFFDDLGADSLVMAKFCARVRKRRGQLPVMSMKDIYAIPTIRGLAEAFGIAEAEAEVNLDAIPTLIQPRDPDPGPVGGVASGEHAAVPHVRGTAAAVLPGVRMGGRAGRRPGVPVDIGRPGLPGHLPAVGFVRRRRCSSACAPFRSWPNGSSSAGGSPSRSASGAWDTSVSGRSRRWSGRTRWPCLRRFPAVLALSEGAGCEGRAGHGDLHPARAGVYRPVHHGRRTRSSARNRSFSATGRTRAGSKPARSPSAGTCSSARRPCWTSRPRWATGRNSVTLRSAQRPGGPGRRAVARVPRAADRGGLPEGRGPALRPPAPVHSALTLLSVFLVYYAAGRWRGGLLTAVPGWAR